MNKNIFITIALLLFCFLTGCKTVNISKSSMITPFTVATYNIRYANNGDSINGNGWGQRYPYIAKLFQFHGFDIFGTEEGKYQQLQDLKTAMPAYDYIGVGRDDGKTGGEFSAIFYRKDMFEVLDHGDFWLSTQTDHPNKGWDAALPRICTWGKFRMKTTGFIFVYYNLHMDHIGKQARTESAKLILQRIKDMPEKLPVILSGDFNVDQFNDSYRLLNTSGVLQDSFDKAEFIYNSNGTFNNFNVDNWTNRRIDHIFLTNDFKVKKYGILTDTYQSKTTKNDGEETYQARTPSDHYPVMIITEIRTNK